jgi:Zn finger protein HypA/HybF involved in hydrogenase expression
MRSEKRKFRCECGETFEADVPFDVSVSIFVDALDAIRCPACKGDSLKLVTNG